MHTFAIVDGNFQNLYMWLRCLNMRLSFCTRTQKRALRLQCMLSETVLTIARLFTCAAAQHLGLRKRLEIQSVKTGGRSSLFSSSQKFLKIHTICKHDCTLEDAKSWQFALSWHLRPKIITVTGKAVTLVVWKTQTHMSSSCFQSVMSPASAMHCIKNLIKPNICSFDPHKDIKLHDWIASFHSVCPTLLSCYHQPLMNKLDVSAAGSSYSHWPDLTFFCSRSSQSFFAHEFSSRSYLCK